VSAVGNQAKCNINARHRRDNYISGDENKSKLVEFIFSKWSIWGIIYILTIFPVEIFRWEKK
jgi:hypothetical protein